MVSSYSSYAQFLEKFAEKVLRAAGPWDKVKDWVTRFGRQVKPDVSINMATGEISLSLGKGSGYDPTPIAPDVFALPGELTTLDSAWRSVLTNFSRFPNSMGPRSKMPCVTRCRAKKGRVCFRRISTVVDGGNAFCQTPLPQGRPTDVPRQDPGKRLEGLYYSPFRKRGRALGDAGLETLLTSSDLIPYDVQRIAHELWDYAELKDKRQLDVSDVKSVIESLVTSQSTYYELLWEQLSARQRAALQAIAYRGASEIYSQGVRESILLILMKIRIAFLAVAMAACATAMFAQLPPSLPTRRKYETFWLMSSHPTETCRFS